MMNKNVFTVNLAYHFRTNGDKATTSVVMMTQGCRHGSRGKLFWSSKVLAENPQRWNGVPVTISHPQLPTGEFVSVNYSEETKKQIVGYIKNAKFDGQQKALKAEIEISLSNPNLPLLQTLKEVSIGVFSTEKPESGTWNNSPYEAVVTCYTPDHLALLSGEIGACSWEDGCGIRTYSDFQNVIMQAAKIHFNNLINTEVKMTPNNLIQEAARFNQSNLNQFHAAVNSFTAQIHEIGEILYPNDVVEDLNVNANEEDFDDKGVLYPSSVYQRTKPPIVKANTKTKNDDNSIGEVLLPVSF